MFINESSQTLSSCGWNWAWGRGTDEALAFGIVTPFSGSDWPAEFGWDLEKDVP